MEKLLSIKFNPLLKSNFVLLPEEFQGKVDRMVAAVKVGNRYFSFAGGKSEESLEMAVEAAEIMGFSEGQLVKVSLLGEEPNLLETLELEPVSNKDFLKIERFSEFVEEELLNQTSVVSPKTIIPLYLPDKEVAYVKVNASEDYEYYLLSQDCELIIAFKPVEVEEDLKVHCLEFDSVFEGESECLEGLVNPVDLKGNSRCIGNISLDLNKTKKEVLKLLSWRLEKAESNKLFKNTGEITEIAGKPGCSLSFSVELKPDETVKSGSIKLNSDIFTVNSLMREGDKVNVVATGITNQLSRALFESPRYLNLIKNDVTLLCSDSKMPEISGVFQLNSLYCKDGIIFKFVTRNEGNLEVFYRSNFSKHKNKQFIFVNPLVLETVKKEKSDTIKNELEERLFSRQDCILSELSEYEYKSLEHHKEAFTSNKDSKILHLYGPKGNFKEKIVKHFFKSSQFNFAKEDKITSVSTFLSLKTRLSSFFKNSNQSTAIFYAVNTLKQSEQHGDLKRLSQYFALKLQKIIKKLVSKGIKVVLVSESIRKTDLPPEIDIPSQILSRVRHKSRQNEFYSK